MRLLLLSSSKCVKCPHLFTVATITATCMWLLLLSSSKYFKCPHLFTLATITATCMRLLLLSSSSKYDSSPADFSRGSIHCKFKQFIHKGAMSQPMIMVQGTVAFTLNATPASAVDLTRQWPRQPPFTMSAYLLF